MNTDELLKIDLQHLWHPYAAMPNDVAVYPVERADGAIITLKDGSRLIDGMSSWWSAIHGYNHPVLNKAITEQCEKMAHVMFGGLTHEPAARLAKKLVDITPAKLQKVFFSDSGSVAIEVAIKMAMQYWQARKQPGKNRLLTIKGGYHGDTFAAMSVCDPVTGMHHLFSDNLQKHYFAERPESRFGENCSEGDISSLEKLLEKNSNNIAAVILEPVVQGAGGMWFYSAEYLRKTRQLCDDYKVLLITDEIATGFGRTGKLFAWEHVFDSATGPSPDICCLGKSLTGGYMTLAATLCSEEIAETIHQSEHHVLMHGPTFMANPLACSVASASIDLLLNYDWQTRIQQIENIFNKEYAAARTLPIVNDVRILGAIGVIELTQAVDMASIQSKFVDHGIWVRPFGKLVYLMPPYIIEEEQLSSLCQKTLQVIAEL